MSEVNFFKKNFPQFVTEMGECLSPYWDLFDAGVEYATHELEKGCDETQELLDKQIEATYKVVEENTKLRKDLEELTITNNYQKVISDKNEQISFLEAQIEKMKFDAVKEAFRQGKVIQYNLDGEWVDWSEPTFDDEPCNYRIKEE